MNIYDGNLVTKNKVTLYSKDEGPIKYKFDDFAMAESTFFNLTYICVNDLRKKHSNVSFDLRKVGENFFYTYIYAGKTLMYKISILSNFSDASFLKFFERIE